MSKSESQEHKDLKRIISDKFTEWGYLSTQEFYDSGHELDIKIRTLDSITIYIEIVKTNIKDDLLMLHRDDADIKILVAANTNLLVKYKKDYDKTAHAEIRKGTLMHNSIIDGPRILDDPDYLENDFKDIIETFITDVRNRKRIQSENVSVGNEVLNQIKFYRKKR